MIDTRDWPLLDKEKLFGYLSTNSFRSERYRLFYVATPKVACTSLKWWFAGLEGVASDVILETDSDESDLELVIHDALGKASSGITRLPQSELEIPLFSDEYFRFAVVRNPYKRIFSAWQSKILLQESLQAEPFFHCDFYHKPIKCIADIPLLFEEFLVHIASFPEDWLDAHWKPQVNLLRPDLIPYSLISRIEEPEILELALNGHVKSNIPSPFAGNHKNVSLFPYLREFITDRSAELIQKLYINDFKRFGYDINPPETKELFSPDALKISIHGIQLVRGRNKRIGDIRQFFGGIIMARDHQVTSLTSELVSVYSSLSWRITRPLRAISFPFLLLRSELSKFIVSLKKNGVKTTIFKIIMRFKRSMMGCAHVFTDKVLSAENAIDDQVALEETCKKKLTLISMVKNERDILDAFSGHALGLFDRIIFVDHGSTDGTREYIEALSKLHSAVELFLFDEPGYFQSQVMTWIVRNTIEKNNSGWVFFLDADEFLSFKSRAELNSALARYNSSPVVFMPWLNLIPLNLKSGAVIGEAFLKPESCSVFGKIAFQPNLISIEDYIVAQGNHALLVGKGYSEMLPAEHGFPIYHFPIRTTQQLRNKIRQGVESYRNMGKNRVEVQGVHWDEINRIMERVGLTDELMVGMIAHYGEPMRPPYMKRVKELMREGYAVIQMGSCYIRPLINIDEISFCQEGKAVSVMQRVGSDRAYVFDWTRIVYDKESRVLRFG